MAKCQVPAVFFALAIFFGFSTCPVYGCTTGVVRLVGSSYTYQGRVEICINNTWGTVCDDKFGSSNARVVCHQLGYSSGYTYYSSTQGTGPIWLDDLSCSGSELTLLQCSHRGIGSHNCDHSEDVSVVCYGSKTGSCTNGDVRLVGGSNSTSGRVVVCADNQWGAVCDDYWDNNDAKVVCRMLNYSSSGAIARGSGYFGEGSGSILLDNIECTGNEMSIFSCSRSSIGSYNCKDARVVCLELIFSGETSSSVIGPVVGGTLGGVFILIIIIVIISSVICWYKHIGICAKLHKKRRSCTTDRDQNDEVELATLPHNSGPMGTTSNTNTMQSTSTSHQNTLPSTTVNTTPHFTGNTLPNVAPQVTHNPHVQHATLPTQGGGNPSPYYYVPPTNAVIKNHQPTTYMPHPYSQVAYLPRQQVYPSTYMVPGQTLPQQFHQQSMIPQEQFLQPQLQLVTTPQLTVSNTAPIVTGSATPQQVTPQSTMSNTAPIITGFATLQQAAIIQDTPTLNPPPQSGTSTTAVTGGSSTTPVQWNNEATVSVPSTMTTTTTNISTSSNEAYGTSISPPIGPEETYDVVGGPAVNEDTVYEVVNSEEASPSHSANNTE